MDAINNRTRPLFSSSVRWYVVLKWLFITVIHDEMKEFYPTTNEFAKYLLASKLTCCWLRMRSCFCLLCEIEDPKVTKNCLSLQ